MGKVDALLIGGGMMYTFYKAQGMEIGKSLLEEDKLELAKKASRRSKGEKREAPSSGGYAGRRQVRQCRCHESCAGQCYSGGLGWRGYWAETIKIFSEEIRKAKTVVWNGPMGVFEMSNFAEGTNAIAQAMADATKAGAVTIVGGGDSASAIAKAGLEKQVSHVSTGGGASLEFLEGKILPGVAALNDKA